MAKVVDWDGVPKRLRRRKRKLATESKLGNRPIKHALGRRRHAARTGARRRARNRLVRAAKRRCG